MRALAAPAVPPAPGGPGPLTEARIRALEEAVGKGAPAGSDPLAAPLARIAQARRAIAEGKSARELLAEPLLAELPLRAPLGLLRAESLLLERREEEAYREIAAALDAHPAPSLALQLLNKQLFLGRGLDKGTEAAELVVRDVPALTSTEDRDFLEAKPALMLAAAHVLEEAGHGPEAQQLYRRIAVDLPVSTESSEAEEALEAAAAAAKRPPLTNAERVARARLFQEMGRYLSLKKEIEAIRRSEEEAPRGDDADFLAKAWGRTLLETGSVDDALGALRAWEKAADRHPDAVVDLARAYGKKGQPDRQEALLDLVLRSAVTGEPGSLTAVREKVGMERAARAEDGDPAAASRAYLELASLFPQSRRADEWLFRGGILAYLSGDRSAAASAFTRIVETLPSSTLVPGAYYWRARKRLAEDDPAAAEDLARATAAGPHSYYGRLAARRLASAPKSAPRAAAEPPPPDASRPEAADAVVAFRARALAAGERGAAALLLRAAGWPEAALGEAEEARRGAPQDPGLTALIVLLHRDLGHNLKARAMLAEAAPGIAFLPRTALPEEIWSVAYPRDHAELLLENGARLGLPKDKVLGLVWQESGFEEEATSRSGAMGLMQLMPETAAEEARKISLAGFTTARLYEPDVNARLGTSYLAGLLTRVDGSWERALAGYNGGPSRAARFWDRLSDKDPELFVESIPIKETRLYVKKVLEAAAEYERIYGPL